MLDGKEGDSVQDVDIDRCTISLNCSYLILIINEVLNHVQEVLNHVQVTVCPFRNF